MQDVLEAIDLESAEEVITGAYMASDIVQGTRAIDQLFLDWSNITYVGVADVSLKFRRVRWHHASQ